MERTHITKVQILSVKDLLAKRIFVRLPEESIMPVYYFIKLRKAALSKLKTIKESGKRKE
jgi:hypothetical protein